MSDTMIDRESVIRQLTQHIARADYIETDLMDCVSVPMLRDALALLREQEPRVLTLEEVRDEYEVVWLETKYLQPTVCLVDNGESDADWICFAFGVDDSYPMSWHLCGKSWRCWSAKPSDEQREAVPWQD